ncbi:MAG: response regulator [Solirubrobacteraceae bacterium]
MVYAVGVCDGCGLAVGRGAPPDSVAASRRSVPSSCGSRSARQRPFGRYTRSASCAIRDRRWCRVTRKGLRLVAAGAGPPRGEAGESSVSVVLAENHTGLRRSLRCVLEMDDGVVVLAEASDLATALRHVGRFRPDVLLFDPWLLDGSGIEAVRCVREQAPSTAIVVLTMHACRTCALRTLEAGALGFVLKDRADSELPEAVRRAVRGREYTSPRVLPQHVAAGTRPPRSGSAERDRRFMLIAFRDTGCGVGAHLPGSGEDAGEFALSLEGCGAKSSSRAALSEHEDVVERTGLLSGWLVRCGDCALLAHRSRGDRCALSGWDRCVPSAAPSRQRVCGAVVAERAPARSGRLT